MRVSKEFKWVCPALKGHKHSVTYAPRQRISAHKFSSFYMLLTLSLSWSTACFFCQSIITGVQWLTDPTCICYPFINTAVFLTPLGGCCKSISVCHKRPFDKNLSPQGLKVIKHVLETFWTSCEPACPLKAWPNKLPFHSTGTGFSCYI